MKHLYYLIFAVVLLTACNESIKVNNTTDADIAIFPDYKGVTIPPNIAPLNFRLTDSDLSQKSVYVVLKGKTISVSVKGSKGEFRIPQGEWQKLLSDTKGHDITVTVCKKDAAGWTGYKPFTIYVATEEVDSHLAYRLIEPGYMLWNEMGIYQRNLQNFDEKVIIENKNTGFNCMNCHSFRNQDPGQMLFHMRKTYPGTYLVQGDKVEKLNTKTDQTISALVYPSWHPGGKYIAFTVNDTKQTFHSNDPNRIEVFDNASDVLVYDVEKHEIFTTPQLFDEDVFETFPTFSADGKTLYFCTTGSRPIPDEYDKVKYSLCSIAFDPDTRSFGSVVDTLYNSAQHDKSVSFPRVSPDGNHLLFTLSAYGNFSIWHKDADLHMLNLQTGMHSPLEKANSNDVESYHSWSSNSRWIVFSSRRIDGLYTRPYLAYIDNSGQAHKAFLMPQENTYFYHKLMKSYNIPEFITGEVKTDPYSIVQSAKNDPGIDVSFFQKTEYPNAVPVQNMAH